MNKLKVMVAIIILAIVIVLLTGCNYQIIEFKYTYNKAICNYDGDKFELVIDKWTDYDGEQLQVISNGKVYLISANKCYLVKE